MAPSEDGSQRKSSVARGASERRAGRTAGDGLVEGAGDSGARCEAVEEGGTCAEEVADGGRCCRGRHLVVGRSSTKAGEGSDDDGTNGASLGAGVPHAAEGRKLPACTSRARAEIQTPTRGRATRAGSDNRQLQPSQQHVGTTVASRPPRNSRLRTGRDAEARRRKLRTQGGMVGGCRVDVSTQSAQGEFGCLSTGCSRALCKHSTDANDDG